MSIVHNIIICIFIIQMYSHHKYLKNKTCKPYNYLKDITVTSYLCQQITDGKQNLRKQIRTLNSRPTLNGAVLSVINYNVIL